MRTLKERFWNKERVEAAKRLWADGHSASTVASMIGATSRNAVLGKLDRLGIIGLPGKGNKVKVKTNGRKTLSKYQSAALVKAQHRAGKAPLGLSAPKPRSEPKQPPALKFEPLPPEPVGIAGVASVLELEDHHCRWPIGEVGKEGFGFCGARKIDGAWQPYCAHHLQTGTTPRVARQAPAAVATRQFLQFERA